MCQGSFRPCFSANEGSKQDRDAWVAAAERQLPADTAILCAQSSCIQTNVRGLISPDADFSIMLGSFPEARCVPFAMHFSDVTEDWTPAFIEADLARKTPRNAPDDYWKVFVIYAVGQGYAMVDDTIKALQAQHPK